MNEVIVRFYTDNPSIDPGFIENLQVVAQKYGLRVDNQVGCRLKADTTDSGELIREERDWLDRRDAERAASLGPLRKDLSHLEKR